VVQLAGFLAATACVPALRAGLSDAAPAHLRGTGFGAFNLASVIFGSAAAPLVTSAIATQLGNQLPHGVPHHSADRFSGRGLPAVTTAMAAQQAEEATTSPASGADHEEGAAAVGET
jgi:MFS family permease